MRHPLGKTSLLLPLVAAGCLAPPPAWKVDSNRSVVRADSADEAREVAEVLSELQPRLLELVPDARFDELEVWVQERPSLYKRPQPAVVDAEGLWSEAHDRILISRHADSLERTLAHELVHAALGPSWRTLPGSLEEGLCDAISARLAPAGAARLRAGRFSSAALACGGLTMDLKVYLDSDPADDDPASAFATWSARIGLTSEELPEGGHLSVFDVQAGLSSSTLASSTKRGYYGLSFLVVERIIQNIGLEGLNALCIEAERAGHSKVPTAWILDAAGLTEDPATWQAAALDALGPDELVELLTMYPHFVVDALVDFLAETGTFGLRGTRARLVLVGPGTALEVSALDFIRDHVETSLASRSNL